MRCFIAIELPTRIRERLAALQRELSSINREVRWTRPEQIHLTLKFLGEVPDAHLETVCSAVASVAAGLSPLQIAVGGVGCFPPAGGARVVWAGVTNPSPELLGCQHAVEQACASLGYPPEDRSFRPHLTIGRARDPRGSRLARTAVQAVQGFVAGSFAARELVVVESVLSRSGATHTVVARAPFGEAAG